tara:strand:- start:143 stop:472 length:330 start_codon:yes stop_codon:yes gene_type:complete
MQKINPHIISRFPTDLTKKSPTDNPYLIKTDIDIVSLLTLGLVVHKTADEVRKSDVALRNWHIMQLTKDVTRLKSELADKENELKGAVLYASRKGTSHGHKLGKEPTNL